ncbi:MAG TPA: DNA starvation/stationary phase protection protein Dps [Gemmatimonadaceae bacterium]|nr:DNA starvation/stationary phase protection protein Dps [Gemmatimonadaceae bacterium]
MARVKEQLRATPIGLPAEARETVVDLLQCRLADAIDLQGNAKQAHWNVKGPNFIALHELFDQVHGAVTEFVDLIAERLVQLGGVAEGTAKAVTERSELPEYPRDITWWEEHVDEMTRSLAEFGKRARTAIDVAAEAGDQTSADVLTQVSAGVDKQLWFVSAHREQR